LRRRGYWLSTTGGTLATQTPRQCQGQRRFYSRTEIQPPPTSLCRGALDEQGHPLNLQSPRNPFRGTPLPRGLMDDIVLATPEQVERIKANSDLGPGCSVYAMG